MLHQDASMLGCNYHNDAWWHQPPNPDCVQNFQSVEHTDHHPGGCEGAVYVKGNRWYFPESHIQVEWCGHDNLFSVGQKFLVPDTQGCTVKAHSCYP